MRRQRAPMMFYEVGTSGERVVIDHSVLSHFRRHQQTRFWHREAGGLLFARIAGKEIRIVFATGPRPTDIRTPFSYQSDRRAEQREIDAYFCQDLHYVGDWHTHPQKRPSPSSRDLKTFSSRVRLSRHRMNGLLFVIVGRVERPRGLLLLIHDGTRHHELTSRSDNSS